MSPMLGVTKPNLGMSACMDFAVCPTTRKEGDKDKIEDWTL